MYLIKDIHGNYFNAEQVSYLEVQDDDERYNVVAFDIECNEFHVSQHGTKAEAQSYMDALANKIMKQVNGTKR